jgi:hypothetical protein
MAVVNACPRKCGAKEPAAIVASDCQEPGLKVRVNRKPLLSFGYFPAHSKSSKWRAPPNPTKDFWEPLSSAPNRIGRCPTAAVSTSKAAGCKRIDGEEAFIRLNAKTERHLPEF